MKIEFGLQPKNESTRCYWGARAIIIKGIVDIPYDRKQYIGERDKEFCWWIDNVGMPYVEQEVRQMKVQTKGSLTSEDGRFTIEWDDRNSGGYLYIGCWENGKLIKEEFKYGTV